MPGLKSEIIGVPCLAADKKTMAFVGIFLDVVWPGAGGLFVAFMAHKNKPCGDAWLASLLSFSLFTCVWLSNWFMMITIFAWTIIAIFTICSHGYVQHFCLCFPLSPVNWWPQCWWPGWNILWMPCIWCCQFCWAFWSLFCFIWCCLEWFTILMLAPMVIIALCAWLVFAPIWLIMPYIAWTVGIQLGLTVWTQRVIWSVFALQNAEPEGGEAKVADGDEGGASNLPVVDATAVPALTMAPSKVTEEPDFLVVE